MGVPETADTPTPTFTEGPAAGFDDGPPGVTLVPWGESEWALVIEPGADSVDLFRAAAILPAGLAFTAAYGEVDVALVFRVGKDDQERRETVGKLRSAVKAAAEGKQFRRWMTDSELTAYRAGRADAFDAVRHSVESLGDTPPDDSLPRRHGR